MRAEIVVQLKIHGLTVLLERLESEDEGRGSLKSFADTDTEPVR